MPAVPFQVGQQVLYLRYFQDPPVEEVTILEPEEGYAWRGELLDSEGNPTYIILTKTVKTMRPYPVFPNGATEAEKDQILKNAMEEAVNAVTAEEFGGVDPSYVAGALVISVTKRLQSEGGGWKAERMRLLYPDTTTYYKIQRPNGEILYVSGTSLKHIPVGSAPLPSASGGGRRRRRQGRRRATRKPHKSRRRNTRK
jgi:hypothetical protein